MKRELTIVTACLVIIATAVACSGPKYTVSDPALTPDQLRLKQMHATVLEAYDWLSWVKESYAAELQARPPEARAAIHKEVGPVLKAAAAALSAADIAVSAGDGRLAQSEIDQYMRFKTQIMQLIARFALKLR